MKKNYKKIILPIILTLGVGFIPLLIGSTLISNSNTTSNKDTSLIMNKTNVVAETEFTKLQADELISKKQKDFGTNWDGSLNEIDFVNITSIAADAFKNNTYITSINLPISVISIGSNAFNGATNLTTLTSYNITNIGDGAFTGTTSLIQNGFVLDFNDVLVPSATINENTKLITLLNTWGVNNINLIKFRSPKINADKIVNEEFIKILINFKIITIDSVWNGVLVESDFDNATSIATGAFAGQSAIKTITFTNSIKTIQANAFSETPNITSITALGIRTIADGAFNNLTGIDGNGDNIINLSIIGDIPSNPDKTLVTKWGLKKVNEVTAVAAPSAPVVPSSIITPAFVNQLLAFKEILSNEPWDGSLIASDFNTATSVADDAFNGKTEITSIILPTGVTSIGANAFDGTTSISKIEFTYSDTLFDSWRTWFSNSFLTNWDKIEWIGGATKPTAVTEITDTYLTKLVRYKEFNSNGNPWNGIINADDLTTAATIGTDAFTPVDALDSKNKILNVTLPKTFISLKANTFTGNTKLVKLTALSVNTIANDAFTGATGLISPIGEINLTFSLKTSSSGTSIGLIDNTTVTNNTELNELFTDWGVTTPTNIKFDLKPVGGIINNNFIDILIFKKTIESATAWDNTLVETDFVDGISIAEGAFASLRSIANITSIGLPLTVKTIDTNAFTGATGLTTITALGVTTIAEGAFTGANAIESGGIKLTKSANINAENAEKWGLDPGKFTFFDPDIITDNTNLYIIIGVTISVVLLLVGLGIGGYFYYRKNINENSGVFINPLKIRNEINSKDKKEDKKANSKKKQEEKEDAKREAIRRLKIEQRIKDSKK